jgi:exosome complex component RRP43
MVNVGYQGEVGSYSEGAIYKYLGNDIQAISCKKFEDVFKSILDGKVDYGLLPIENSLGGSIHANYDLMLKYSNLHILGEYNHKIVHNLIVYPGTKLEDIELVISHWQALSQCEDYLNNKNLNFESRYDTAGSCKYIKENEIKNMAAIASNRAALEYGLEILDTSIEDNKNNYTRFLLIGTKSCEIKENISYKTSLVFSFNNMPGALHKSLSVFALRDIDLTKIESRPNRNSSNNEKYSYYFYVDFISHPNKMEFSNAIRHLREIVSVLRILGTYPQEGEESIIKSEEIEETYVVGILGFGRFGQFLGKELVKRFKVVATSRSSYENIANSYNIKWCNTLNDFFSNKLDYLIISTSILSFEKIIKKVSHYNLKDTLVVDVCSVKTFPKEVMLKYLPRCDLLCTHPMFGPDSGKISWAGLPFVYENVKITNNERANKFLNFFADKGCSMLELSCEKHDEYAASSQFITHLTGRVLSKMNLTSTPINTNGFNMLLGLIENTESDSFELFRGLYKYNKNSAYELQKVRMAFNKICTELLNIPTSSTELMLSNQVLNIEESKTSKMHEMVLQKIKAGKKVISLAIGQPNFTPNKKVSMGGIKAIIDNKVKYTKVCGILELRSKISDYLKNKRDLDYEPTEIICTSGAKHGVYESLQCLCNINDEVIIPAPYWVSYPSMVKLLHGVPKIVETKKENKFCLTGKELENAITKMTKVVILCNPNNPTGVAYSKKQLESLVKVLKKNPQFFIICDEIYEGLMHNEKFISLSEYKCLRNRLIIVGGFSKTYAMCGYRLGYIASSINIIKYINRIQGQTIGCPSSISQNAALNCFGSDIENWINTECESLVEKKNYIMNELSKAGINYIEPNAAFYIFVEVKRYFNKNIKNSVDFCKYFLDIFNIACTPGSAFGNDDYIRICYSTDNNTLKEVVCNLIKNTRLL